MPFGTSQKERKAAADAVAFVGNVSSSVLLIYSNKLLMSRKNGYGFRFATTLCALHFLTCYLGTIVLKLLGYIQPSKIARSDLVIFALAANLSIVSLNLSLMLNPVGFYQISKLCIVPCTCLVEAFWLNRRFTKRVIGAVLLVLAGVAIVTITDFGTSSNALGVGVAFLSVGSSTLQQIFCRTMQQRNSLGHLEFLSHTAPAQGFSLIFFGPFIDYSIGGEWLFGYHSSFGSSVALTLSCTIAIAVNISQFACLGRFQAVSFQVMGHAKTVLVLLVGWALLGDQVRQTQLFGMVIAITGMVLYGYFTSSKGGRQRRRSDGEVHPDDSLVEGQKLGPAPGQRRILPSIPPKYSSNV